MESDKKIEELIKALKEIVNNLEIAKDGTEEEKNLAIQRSFLPNGLCCGSCVAVSTICTPDATPNKCKGGCTATSFAF